MLDVYWYDEAKEQFLLWEKKDRRKYDRVLLLLEEIKGEHPYSGIGQPEPLRYELSGYWSRRIDQKNRIVYTIAEQDGEQAVFILQCGTHYKAK